MIYPEFRCALQHEVSDSDELASVGEFFLVGLVDDAVCLKLGQQMLRMAGSYTGQETKPDFTLHISTGGGSTSAGFMLGSFIRRIQNSFGIKVNIHIAGNGMSMGVTIRQFANRRLINRYSVAMCHDVSIGGGGVTADHKDSIKHLDIIRTNVAELLAERNSAGHNTPEYWLAGPLRRGDWFYSASEAVELGLFDEVTGDLILDVLPELPGTLPEEQPEPSSLSGLPVQRA